MAKDKKFKELEKIFNPEPTAQESMPILPPVAIGPSQVNQPKDLDTIIKEAAERYNIDPKLMRAIIRQESNFKVGAVNKRSKDYGLGQINENTIKAFGFDKDKLLKDPHYSADASAQVLADFKKRYEKREPADSENPWYTRYNASRPSKRKIYLSKIQQHLADATDLPTSEDDIID